MDNPPPPNPDPGPGPEPQPQQEAGEQQVPEWEVPNFPFFQERFGEMGPQARHVCGVIMGALVQIAVSLNTLPSILHAIQQTRFLMINHLAFRSTRANETIEESVGELHGCMNEALNRFNQYSNGFVNPDEVPDEEDDTAARALGRKAGRRTKEYKIPEFDGKTPEEWLLWRDQKFRRLVRLNNWTDDRAITILPTLFKGAYQQNLSQVDMEGMDVHGYPKTLDQVLEECTNVILPPAETALAQQQVLHHTTQNEGESLATYFSRFKAHFVRAFPNANAEDEVTKTLMLETVSKGIHRQTVRERVHAQMVQFRNMEDILEYAQRQEAAMLRDRTRRNERGIQSIQRKRGASQKQNDQDRKRPRNEEVQGTPAHEVICGHCKKRGHLEHGCWTKKGQEHLKAILKKPKVEPNDSKGKTKGKKQGKSGVNAMQAPGQENS